MYRWVPHPALLPAEAGQRWVVMALLQAASTGTCAAGYRWRRHALVPACAPWLV